MLRNTSTQYGCVHKLLHWVMALGILFLVALGFLMTNIQVLDHETVYTLHKSIGITVLGLAVIRVVWKWVNPRLLAAATVSWQRRLAWCVHGLLYLVMFVMPISGWVMSTAAQHIPNFFWVQAMPMPFISANGALAGNAANVHYYTAYVLIVLLLGHIGGAIYHHCVLRDNTLQRML